MLNTEKVKTAVNRAFDRMLKAREEAGKKSYTWETGEDVYRWWTYDIYEDPNQLSFFEEE